MCVCVHLYIIIPLQERYRESVCACVYIIKYYTVGKVSSRVESDIDTIVHTLVGRAQMYVERYKYYTVGRV